MEKTERSRTSVCETYTHSPGNLGDRHRGTEKGGLLCPHPSVVILHHSIPWWSFIHPAPPLSSPVASNCWCLSEDGLPLLKLPCPRPPSCRSACCEPPPSASRALSSLLQMYIQVVWRWLSPCWAASLCTWYLVGGRNSRNY